MLNQPSAENLNLRHTFRRCLFLPKSYHVRILRIVTPLLATHTHQGHYWSLILPSKHLYIFNKMSDTKRIVKMKPFLSVQFHPFLLPESWITLKKRSFLIILVRCYLVSRRYAVDSHHFNSIHRSYYIVFGDYLVLIIKVKTLSFPFSQKLQCAFRVFGPSL